MQLGFQNDTLRLIQLLDHLDQITRIVLSHVEENPQIPASQFRFTVPVGVDLIDRKSTRLNSSHALISYAVFCLKKKKKNKKNQFGMR